MDLAKDTFSDHPCLMSKIAGNEKSWLKMERLCLLAFLGSSRGSSASGGIAMILRRRASLWSSPNGPRDMQNLLRIDLKCCQIETSLLQEVQHSLHMGLRWPIVA